MGEHFLIVEVVTSQEGGAGCEGDGEIPSLRARTLTVLHRESTFDIDTRDL